MLKDGVYNSCKSKKTVIWTKAPFKQLKDVRLGTWSSVHVTMVGERLMTQNLFR